MHPIAIPIIATVLYALTSPRWNLLFLLSFDTQVEVCYSHWLSTRHPKFKIQKSFLLTRPWWLLPRLQRIWYDSNYCASPTWQAATARSLHVCAGQHTWNKILPSSPGPMPLMAVKSSFLRASLAVPIFQFLQLFTLSCQSWNNLLMSRTTAGTIQCKTEIIQII